MKLLLLGATGLVGSRALQLALGSDAVSEVVAPTRALLPSHVKLSNPVAPQLEDLLAIVQSCEADAAICALGTTMAIAGSKAAFRHVDYELPLAFGKAAKAAGVATYAIVTAMGASPDSRFFYPRTKGELERDVQEIGFRSLTICRPNLIDGERKTHRRTEGMALMLARLLSPVLPVTWRVNTADSIARALLDAAVAAKPGRHWIYSQDMH